ncbi:MULTISPECIES: DUF3275 family protein [unclassified Halomonas]|uniref:DUF3275 family protein n=1 Tax=unclassified Halomonas TaxID=2609666 RepID=UPI0028835C2A|nr:MULTISPECIES: DUF3275 family protein [unclassified Halomonas]MDT0501344.1 DUF3275 family protein [Halomonas sp. PAR7]MDT0512132.1 DUF3275 family protein [Halomonas sp. LES1]MDT0590731.1 DUF3275 family protein [Halomonas sp. PAR8]
MIKIPGRLTVRTIHGRNGPFNVGRLAASIGEFVIKDPQLDQFSEGMFEGEFLLLEIRPASYFAGGRLVVEVRAKVGEMLLTEDGMLVTQHGPRFDSAEMDPLEEEATPAPSEPPPPSTPGPGEPMAPPARPPQGEAGEAPGLQAPDAYASGQEANPDAELFGLLWPLGQSVKLDPTVDRALFRRQVSRLKELGYRFQAPTQTWQAAA